MANNKLVLFWSSGCEPCQHQKPLIEKLSKEMKISTEFVSVDTEDALAHAREYGVKGWPHLLIIKDDIVVDEIIGYDLGANEEMNKKRVSTMINNAQDRKSVV